MRKVISTAVGRATLRGWVFAFLGFVAILPPLATAVLTAPPQWPTAVRVTGFVLGFAVVVSVMALPRGVRRGSVLLANGLLGTGLLVPGQRSRSRWRDRLCTAVWLSAHMAVGGAVTLATGVWVFMAVAFPAVWLGDGGAVEVVVFSVPAPHGWRGAWTLALGAGCLLTAGWLTAAGAAVLRRLAVALLGPGTAERIAVAEERTRTLARRNRLAQDLHDSIGHTLTASTIQAAAALELLDREPEAVRRALTSIEETSRAAMDDLDHVVGLLREEPPVARPHPTLADLDALAERVRHTGAGLTLETEGDFERVPVTVSREVYRILQEGLTNVLKHGGTTDVRMRVAVSDARLRMELSNPIATTKAWDRGPRQGHGLAGIGERVRLLRGELSAGPTRENRWRITADIPLRSTS